MYANYTYFHNHTRKTFGKPLPVLSSDELVDLFETGTFPAINNSWANTMDNPCAAPVDINGVNIAGAFSPVTAFQIFGKWSFYFNQFDFELGRKYWVSRFVNLRPYLGVRGAMTHTNLVVESNHNFPSEDVLPIGENLFGTVPVKENKNVVRNKFWGAGLVAGLQPEFRFHKNFMLFGNIDGSLLWGRFKGKNKYRSLTINQLNIGNPPIQSIQGVYGPNHVTQTSNFHRMQGILDLALGLRWEQHWKEDRYSTAFDLGWEHHYWFDFGQYQKDVGSDQAVAGASQGVIDNFSHNRGFTTNLGFGGLVFRGRFDF